MHEFALVLAGILLAGAPLVLATLGETITEKAGVINLSLDGTILLAAMTSFAVAVTTGNPWFGAVGGMAVGAVVALVLGLTNIYLGQSQVAGGFILTLLARDLAYFLGHPFSRQPGPDLGYWGVPGLSDTPILNALLGRQSPTPNAGCPRRVQRLLNPRSRQMLCQPIKAGYR